MNKLVTFGDSFLAQRRVVKQQSRSWIDMVCKENNFKTGWENLLFLSLQEPSETFKRPWKLKQQEILQDKY